MITCPRCRRKVGDFPRAKRAHRQSCVAIPLEIPKGWGVKQK